MGIAHILFNERLDGNALEEMYEGDYEHAAIVFGQFVKSAPVQMEGIAVSFEQDAVEEFRTKVHKLKPVFSFVGLTGLSNKAAMLEQQCKLTATLKTLEGDYLNFKNDFDTHLPLIQEVLQKLNNEI